ncbi:PEP-CTERM system TPR-repeat protein PrsT [Endozoicomonas sp. G2_1]|uniref:XrtA/PEP-CTERM system TPR-repeat protein PrsT n=1 Tax=Endozoicomonas sp. G2_1 TaxID=2821091 RepID=UPI001ADB2C7B|nr:XrtA/PEP-CTERM system TPR-repeat protein PrsT [Endozoicomonas sp. G2_1]MBO9490497.1 PEP-CTERM system TPR-repeat protein PrsT [Endozoicomonas sp. G2_1]
MLSILTPKKWLKTAITGAIICGITACSDNKSADDYISEAQTHLASEDFSASIILLKNAIVAEPNNVNARLMLGQAYLGQGDGLSAVKELEKVRQLDKQKYTALPLLARAYLISDNFQEILELKNTEKLSSEMKVEYLAYKTLAHIRLEQLDQATESANEAESLVPGSFFSILAKAYHAAATEDVDKAELLVKRALSQSKSNPEALMLQAQIANVQQNYEQAAESLKLYVEAQPAVNIAYLMLAEAYLNNEQYADAEKYADIILTALPNQPLANHIKAAAEFAKQNYENAKDYADKALTAGFQQLPVKLLAGVSAYNLKNFEQANYHLSAIVEYLPAEHPAQKMYILSRLELGLIENISDALSDFSPKNAQDNQFLSTLSANLYSLGAVSEAKKLASKAKVNFDNTEDRLRASALSVLMNNNPNIAELEDIAENNPKLKQARLLLAHSAVKRGELDKALEIAKQWQTDFPESSEGHNLLAAIYFLKNDMAAAKSELEASYQKGADGLYALTELARVNFQQGELDKAKRYINDAIELYPNSPKALQYNYIIHRDDIAIEKISNALAQNTTSTPLVLVYTGALVDKQQYKQALSVLKGLEKSIGTSKEVWIQTLVVHSRLKDQDKVRSTLEEWRKLNPYHVEPVVYLANYYKLSNQREKALTQINRALNDQHSDSLLLKLGKMQILLDLERADDAALLYEDLKTLELRPELYAGIKGRIKLIEKDYQAAIPELKTFYRAQPSGDNAVYLAIALSKNDQQESSIELLEKYLSNSPQDTRVRSLVASQYLAKDHDKAKLHYQKIIEQHPNNVLALNNLAWLTMDSGELQQAEKYIEKAYKLAPNIANVADTYGQILLKLDKKRDALAKAKEATERSKQEDVDIMLNYVDVLIENGRKNEASKLLTEIRTTTQSQKQKVANLLKRI